MYKYSKCQYWPSVYKILAHNVLCIGTKCVHYWQGSYQEKAHKVLYIDIIGAKY